MDPERLLASITPDFRFDDPVDPAPITADKLVAYMHVWPDRAAALGGSFDFEMTDRTVQDRDGMLTEWYWWRLKGTSAEGSALIKTCDQGVMFEGLNYFRSPWPLLR
jgi:hypothetical protein